MQPRHPLRETLLEGAPSDACAVTSLGPSVPPPPAASPGGVCSSISHSFSSFVPDVRSRVAFAFAFLCALAVSAYWLQLTIRSKWLFQQQHPTQVVSYDSVDSLPALFGLQFDFHDYVLPLQWTHLRRVTPILSWPTGIQSAAAFVACTDITVEGLTYAIGQTPMPSTVCESLGANGRPVLDPANAPTGELDGSSARSLPLSAWPLQFSPGLSGYFELCFQVDVLVNQTAMLASGFDSAPRFTMLSPSASALLAVHEIVAAGLGTSPSNPAVQGVFARDDYPIISTLPFDSITELQVQTSRTVQVSGDTRFVFDYQLAGTSPLAPSWIRQDWQRVLNGTMDAQQRAELQTIKDDPTSLYASALVCAQPRSFTMQSVQLFHSYGWSSFLSDVGGFVSILSLVFVALFPLTVRVTKARDFLPIWMSKRCKKEKDSNDADTGLELHGMQHESIVPRISV